MGALLGAGPPSDLQSNLPLAAGQFQRWFPSVGIGDDDIVNVGEVKRSEAFSATGTSGDVRPQSALINDETSWSFDGLNVAPSACFHRLFLRDRSATHPMCDLDRNELLVYKTTSFFREKVVNSSKGEMLLHRIYQFDIGHLCAR
ncbi:MAG TPA: hypothetical protein VMM15_00450 [Bradyrhizobium sp.]|nr:hypothetical protein [Bradyrhizobium sp.]